MTDQDYINLINGSYLIAAVLFIAGLMLLRTPATARNGNRLSALAMLIAASVTLVDRNIVEFEFIVGGVVVGAVIGVVLARTVQMTAMPQMVAVFNAFGGAASALLAGSEFIRLAESLGPSDDNMAPVRCPCESDPPGESLSVLQRIQLAGLSARRRDRLRNTRSK